MRQTARRRRLGAKPRDQWLAENSASRTEPWKALGISRPAYYRKGLHRTNAAQGPVPSETGACALITSLRVEHGPVSAQSPAESPAMACSGGIGLIVPLMLTGAFTSQADHAGLWPVALAMLAFDPDRQDYKEAA